MESLVICIGNVGRGDDGVAHRVADLLGPGVAARIVKAHQLDVALAHDVAQASAVVFVDAVRREEPLAAVEPVEPGAGGHVHEISPAGLLGVARSVFGRAPHAWLVTVAAPQMAHGEGLSPRAEAASVEAASMVRELLRSAGEGSGA
jgi:hydrogenase maturation protease